MINRKYLLAWAILGALVVLVVAAAWDRNRRLAAGSLDDLAADEIAKAVSG